MPARSASSAAARAVRDYVVALKEPAGGVPYGRAEVVGVNLRSTAAFVERLRSLLRTEGLLDEVKDIGGPMSLPFVALSCTPKVASRIRKMPEVDSVVEDADVLSVIR